MKRALFTGCFVLLVLAFISGQTKGVKVEEKRWPQDEFYTLPEPTFFPPYSSTFDSIPKAGVQLGRMLFYDPILSRDSSMHCGSCHKQSLAFADSIAFSKGLHGRPQKRNTPGLFNLIWQNTFFWDGRSANLEHQALVPVRHKNEMDLPWPEAIARLEQSERYRPLFTSLFGNGPMDSLWVTQALAWFQFTLVSHQSKYDKVLRGEARFTESEYRGYVIANDQSMGNCLHCHPTDGAVLGSTYAFENNGLDAADSPSDYADAGRMDATGKVGDAGFFKVPSLRNVALTAPYMHDGRFASLEEVIDFYSEGVQPAYNISNTMAMVHHGGMQLTPQEKADVLAFLHTLTDTVFTNNPAFGNPFK